MTLNALFICFVMFVGCVRWTLGGAVASSERGYELNDTSAEITPEDYLDQPGPSDSHEASVHNEELKQQYREKRSFEFLVGLINNNSKYEVIRSDPELGVNKIIPKEHARSVADRSERRDLRERLSERSRVVSVKSQNGTAEATKLLLDLLAKIVTYPEHWRQIHQILRNLDQDLVNSQHILRHHQEQQQLQERNVLEENFNPDSKRKLVNSKFRNNILSTTTNKWPIFDETDETTAASVPQQEKNIEKIPTNKKTFAYHKVTGKPPHLKKTPTAYIAVSAISPKPSDLEEDFLLESELHQLKPWKNKRSSKRD